MVIYTLLVASNVFNRLFDFLGSWKRYIFETESEDMDGFDPSGLMILQKGIEAKTSIVTITSLYYNYCKHSCIIHESVKRHGNSGCSFSDLVQ